MSTAATLSWQAQRTAACDIRRERIASHRAQHPVLRNPEMHHERALDEDEILALTGRMVYGVVHDIRHYLSAIAANTEIMNDPRTSLSTRAEAGQDIRDAVKDICNMLELTLLCCRQDSQIPMSMHTLDSIAQHAIRMVKCHPDGKSAEITFHGAALLRQRINPVLLLSALYNLVLNASQALSHCTGIGRVHVSVTRSPGATHIRIEDNGPGIPPEARAALFESSHPRNGRKGRGLGIAIADYAARAHRGSLKLEHSTVGHTVFCLTLPDAPIPFGPVGTGS